MQVRTAVLPAFKGGAVQAVSGRVDFEYVGSTSLEATGPVTLRRYHFAAPGSVVAVDARDAAALGAVPKLRRLQRR